MRAEGLPYIDRAKRNELLDTKLSYVPLHSVGELNFAISSLCHEYVYRKGLNYQSINDVVGVLSCASQEFYRTVAADYETNKALDNGSVSGLDAQFMYAEGQKPRASHLGEHKLFVDSQIPAEFREKIAETLHTVGQTQVQKTEEYEDEMSLVARGAVLVHKNASKRVEKALVELEIATREEVAAGMSEDWQQIVVYFNDIPWTNVVSANKRTGEVLVVVGRDESGAEEIQTLHGNVRFGLIRADKPDAPSLIFPSTGAA